MQASKNHHDSQKKFRDDEFMFRDRSRLLLDEALYPNVYRREMTFRFTFQTFNITGSEVFFKQHDVDFDFELERLLNDKARLLFLDNLRDVRNGIFKLLCRFENVYIPS